MLTLKVQFNFECQFLNSEKPYKRTDSIANFTQNLKEKKRDGHIED
jgi:hypothetical protein